MDKIEIIENFDEDDEELDEEEDEEYEEEYEEISEELSENKDSIKKKTDRELLENITLRLISLEQSVKKIQDDLVDTYNLMINSESDDED